MITHLAFGISRSSIVDGILIPKFYDPDLAVANKMAADSGFTLPGLAEVLLPGEKGSKLGNWIPRELYGSGDVPFVRTSDLSNWRIRPDYKKGVAVDVYERLRKKQDVRSADLLMVAHGSYLVGAVAMVTDEEPQVVLSDHIFRLRCNPEMDCHLLLAALSTSFVRRQVRARQFSADIIDKIGERHLGIRVPIPKSKSVREEVSERVAAVICEQTAIRAEIRAAAQSDLRMTRERSAARHGFTVKRKDLAKRILIPKYYDPVLERDLADAQRRDPDSWVSIGDVVGQKQLSVTTGVEVGKMAYGTGSVPFIRTTDLADWAIKRDVRQGVSEIIFNQYQRKAAVRALDVLLIRDGTYLVGSSALATEDDLPAVFCGGIYRLRSLNCDALDPHALLALLNLPIVRRQLRARQFTRDVIDTLGGRLMEVLIPSPSSEPAKVLGRRVQEIVQRTAALKNEIGSIIDRLEPASPPTAQGRPGWSMR